MIFAKRLGFRPETQTLVAGPDWKQFAFPFTDFGGLDGSDIMGIVWAAGPKTGALDLRIDDVRLQ